MPEPEQPVGAFGAAPVSPDIPEAVEPPAELLDEPAGTGGPTFGPVGDGSMTDAAAPEAGMVGEDDELADTAGGAEPADESGPAQVGQGGLVELLVAEVRAAVPLRPGQEAGLAVLAEAVEPFRSLHIYIGQPEARAIQAGRRGDYPSRPGTWDLLLAAVEALGGHLERAVIERVEEARHFYASIEISSPDGVKRLECRPSDAIALVVRVPSAGLYTTEEVVQAAGAYP